MQVSTSSEYKRILEVFRRFREDRAEPRGELEYVNEFTLLVAVVLSAQATDVGVNKATAGCSAWQTRQARCWSWARKD